MSTRQRALRLALFAPALMLIFVAGSAALRVQAQGLPTRMERQGDPLNHDPKRPDAYDMNLEQQNAVIGKEVERALHEGNAATDATPPRYNDAEKSYQEALKLNPKEARAYLGLGRLYAAQNRVDDSITAFKKAIEVKPKLAEAYFNLGMIYAATGKKEAALEQQRALQGLNADLAKRLKEFIDK
jgi:tetratricopeptide (TPR) repeat protein